MYKRSNNYQSVYNDSTDKGVKLLKKYRVKYENLVKSISQDKEGIIIFETEDGKKKYLYCNLTNDWYLDDKDETRKRLLTEREKRLESEISTRYMMKPTTILPDVAKPCDSRQ